VNRKKEDFVGPTDITRTVDDYKSGSEAKADLPDTSSYAGKNIAPIAQMASSLGVPQYAAKYDNGNVYLGGYAVPSVYESNGTAYGETDKIEEAAKNYKKATGSIGFGEIKDSYEDYQTKMKNILDDYMNYSDWRYNPEKDAAYLSYAEAAKREGQKAYEDAIGRMSARTGGYMNTAAATAASQSMNEYLDSVQDKIPEFMEQSYNRYRNKKDSELEAIKMMDDINKRKMSDYIDIAGSVNELNRQNAMDEFERKNAERDLERNILYSELYDDILGLDMRKKDIENVINEANVPYADGSAREKYLQEIEKTINLAKENSLTEQKTNNQIIENNIMQAENIYKNAVIRGYFLPDEEEYLNLKSGMNPTQAYLRFKLVEEAK